MKTCDFFVVPGNSQALLGMPDIDTLDVLTINCNTKDTQTQNQQIYNKTESQWQYTNNIKEKDKPKKHNINT